MKTFLYHIKWLLVLTAFASMPLSAQEATEPAGTPSGNTQADKTLSIKPDMFSHQYVTGFEQRRSEAKGNDDLTLLYKDITSHWRELVYLSYKELLEIISNPSTWHVSFRKKSESGSVHTMQYNYMKQHVKSYKKIAQLRADVFHQLRSPPHNVGLYSFSNLKDLNAELFSVPAKILGNVANRALAIRENANQGFLGIFKIIYELFILMAIMILPFIAIKVAKKIKKNQKPSYNLRYQIKQQRKLNLKYVSSVIQKNSFWISALVCAFFIENLLKRTSFSDFSIFIKLFYLFTFVRFIRFCFLSILKTVLRYMDFNSETNKKNLESSGAFVSSYFSIAICLMYLFYVVTGGTIVYTMISYAFNFLTVFLCIALATRWAKPIGQACEQSIAKPMGPMLANGCRGFFSFIYATPSFFILFFTFFYRKIVYQIKRNEVAKGFFAKVIRKKIESQISETRRQTLTADHEYIQSLQNQKTPKLDQILPPERSIVENITKEINEWRDDLTEEHNMALVGDSGIGKTTFANYLNQTLELDSIVIDLPRQLYTPKKIKEAIENAINPWLSELDSSKKELSTQDSNTKDFSTKKVIIVDDVQNIFISMLGGFNSYLEFIKLMNATYADYYWICFFNRSSWQYLEGVFERSIYFSEVQSLLPWDEEQIKKLILTNKQLENYSLSFKSIAEATQTSIDYASLDLAKQQYFQLLWEQSKGIPRVALALWQTSLFEGFKNTLEVRLPPEQKIDVLSSFKDESHFILSEIIRHKSLSRSELVKATNIPLGTVSNCLKLAKNHKIIEKNNKGRYQISALWQIETMQYLKSRNFIYGSVV